MQELRIIRNAPVSHLCSACNVFVSHACIEHSAWLYHPLTRFPCLFLLWYAYTKLSENNGFYAGLAELLLASYNQGYAKHTDNGQLASLT